MTTSAIVMMLLSMALLWGGAAYCISIALKKK